MRIITKRMRPAIIRRLGRSVEIIVEIELSVPMEEPLKSGRKPIASFKTFAMPVNAPADPSPGFITSAFAGLVVIKISADRVNISESNFIS
jgi:hypothetical protein